MERTDRGKDPQSLKNQPYDESSEVEDGEEVASVSSPTPRGHRQPEWSSNRKLSGIMSASGSRKQSDEKPRAVRAREPAVPSPGPARVGGEEEEEDSEEDDDSDDDDDDDDDETTEASEGAYDPADYANSPVNTETRESFQYITRYTPQHQELDLCLKPFIPDFIPAVGDIDAFLKV